MKDHMAILQIDKNGYMLYGNNILQYIKRYIFNGDIKMMKNTENVFKFIDWLLVDNIMDGLKSEGFKIKRIVKDPKEEPRNIWINGKCIANPKYKSLV